MRVGLFVANVKRSPNGVEGKIVVIHDWDYPVNKPLTNLKIAFWLLTESVFGRFGWVQKHLPSYIVDMKFNCARAMLELDALFGVDAVWGLTATVITRYPQFIDLLHEQDCKMRFHYHEKHSKVGRGKWFPRLNVSKENMVYDRRYSLLHQQDLPKPGEAVVWHCDHPNNLYYYILFLQRAFQEGLI